ncbi:hypothetical protein TNCV_4644971 [Trichonephila clavipes]|nr:hypothetical protein TNCV_4644971 [Trichonephila clavipes]
MATVDFLHHENPPTWPEPNPQPLVQMILLRLIRERDETPIVAEEEPEHGPLLCEGLLGPHFQNENK